MQIAEWDSEWKACFGRLRAKGYEPVAAQKMAVAITTARYGPRPAKPPLWLRLALKVAGRKLEQLKPAEERTMKDRILNSTLYGLAAAFAWLQANGIPKTEQEWFGLVGVVGAAVWGKFSHSEAIMSPKRPVWTDEKRAAQAEASAEAKP